MSWKLCKEDRLIEGTAGGGGVGGEICEEEGEEMSISGREYE